MTGPMGEWCAGHVAAHMLETSLGAYSALVLDDWNPAGDHFVADIAGRPLVAQPDVWTDGSLVRDEVTCVCFGVAGVYAMVPGSP